MMKKIQYLAAILGALFLAGCEEEAGSPPSASPEIKGSGAKPVLSSQTSSLPKGSSAKPAPEGNDAENKAALPDRKALKEKLTPIQYEVAVEDGTEPPFRNEYWDNKKAGIYVDIISGKPLFSSKEKFKSGTGWPSFWEPLEKEEIVEIVDRKFGWVRTEVRSKTGDTHLGHVFDDGPEPTGLRYCINSASLRFVPVEDFEKEGLAKYAKLFEEAKTEEKKP